jgi:SpoVK/Ycf46/Vps4 family AAA+-type ATPase
LVANAIANYLNKKVLLINFPSLGALEAGENLKFIFREAKLNDAVLFFDECESIFETREKNRYNVNMLLTEIERYISFIVGVIS